MREESYLSFTHEAPTGSGDESDAPEEPIDNGVHRVPAFRVILTADCVVENLAPLKGESDEHARSDATFAVCQAFNQALAIVNEREKMAFNSIDFRIEAHYHPIDKDHPFGGFGENGE